ncbi:MAG: hypothetical protein BGO51_08815 [Rhodospirillales bacterium 69-11]|nr:DUF1275 family protein [Rhodospirillales bacterium]OJW26030.1 MAG: hypothetical protein BGO51_08815 [Rhodospirillales bacterium 69-11]
MPPPPPETTTVTARLPATRLPSVALAAGMAFLAGATDIAGLVRLRDLFVSFMSGNTTLLGLALGQADLPHAGRIAAVIGLFVAGAAAGTVLATLLPRRHALAVMAATTALLAAALPWPPAAPWILIVAMGLLNAAMTRIGRASVSLTYVTGTLVRVAQGIGLLLCGRRPAAGWALQAALWLCLLAGAVAAVRAEQAAGADLLWPLPAMAAVLTLLAAAVPDEADAPAARPPAAQAHADAPRQAQA